MDHPPTDARIKCKGYVRIMDDMTMWLLPMDDEYAPLKLIADWLFKAKLMSPVSDNEWMSSYNIWYAWYFVSGLSSKIVMAEKPNNRVPFEVWHAMWCTHITFDVWKNWLCDDYQNTFNTWVEMGWMRRVHLYETLPIWGCHVLSEPETTERKDEDAEGTKTLSQLVPHDIDLIDTETDLGPSDQLIAHFPIDVEPSHQLVV